MRELVGSQPELQIGFHGTEAEIKFVEGVIVEIRDAGYQGPIELVGSRADGNWVSRSGFSRLGEVLLPEDWDDWYAYLNALAKEKDYGGKQISLLVDELRADAPAVVRDFLKGKYGRPEADFDLLLAERPKGVFKGYYDARPEGTGQDVDTWTPDEVMGRA